MDAGLTISELAKRAGVARDTISYAERGQHSLQATTLSKIARALGKAPSELLAEEERLAPKVQSSSPEPSFNDVLADERREALYDMVLDAARRQEKQDQQAAARALSSERPQTYFMRHENEVVHRLLEYSADELAGTLIEMARRVFQLEQAQAEQSRPETREYSALLEEKGFSSEQIAAWAAQNERDEEFIKCELEKMSPKDILEALIASPGMRKIRESYHESDTEVSAPPRSETA